MGVVGPTLDALVFWALVMGAGLLALPLAELLFPRLAGGGLVLARPLGLLLLTFPLWLVASLHLVDYGRTTVFAAVALFVAVCVALRLKGLGRVPAAGPERSVWVAGEILFSASFALCTLLRSFAPQVWQTEKPMDMAIVNAVNRSVSFPPHDAWQSGTTINYYYYGHYSVAFLGRLTGIDPAIVYNLGVALFFALTTTAVFGVAATLYRSATRSDEAPRRSPVLVGLTAAAFAMILGNLAGGVQLLRHPGRLGTYDWWSPSRVIAGTANEFPSFSYLLGDLHAHVMATSFALVVVAYAIQLAVHGPPSTAPDSRGWRSDAELALACLGLGVLYPLNSLDYPTACLLGGGALLLWAMQEPGRARRAALYGIAWLAGSIVLFLPFWLQFTPPSGGIGLVEERVTFTRFARDYLLIYGLALWILLALFATRFRVPARYAAWGGAVALFVLVLLAPRHLSGAAIVVLLTALATYAAFSGRPTAPSERMLWLITAVGIGLVAIGEVVYIRDAFDGTSSFRFNTVFKAGFQAWTLLMIAAGVTVYRAYGLLSHRIRRLWLGGLAVAVILALAYPVLGAYSHSARFRESPTLDGMRWLEQRAPGDAAAIGWLRENVQGAPVILEQVGPDFDPDGRARISTFTGLPAVLGWEGHEVQWGHDPGTRQRDVRRIYGTGDLGLARSLLHGYGVRYVIVGSVERKDYPAARLDKFALLGTPVFRSVGTTIYRIGEPITR